MTHDCKPWNPQTAVGEVERRLDLLEAESAQQKETIAGLTRVCGYLAKIVERLTSL